MANPVTGRDRSHKSQRRPIEIDPAIDPAKMHCPGHSRRRGPGSGVRQRYRYRMPEIMRIRLSYRRITHSVAPLWWVVASAHVGTRARSDPKVLRPRFRLYNTTPRILQARWNG